MHYTQNHSIVYGNRDDKVVVGGSRQILTVYYVNKYGRYEILAKRLMTS
jgi:hypothetical protein